MKPASVSARIAAFWIDLLALLTGAAVLSRLVWTLFPVTEVRESAMQLFTPQQFRVFWLNAGAVLGYVASYLLLVPAFNGGATLGQRLTRIRCVRLEDGAPLDTGRRRVMMMFSFMKAAALLLCGPLAAAGGGNLALSLAFLFGPVIALTAVSALSWSAPDGVGPQERMLGYRYVAAE
jgi:hypothetical protein